MVFSVSMSDRIISVARKYVGRSFDYENFNCVHFVRETYQNVGINLPRLERNLYPPADFHLSSEEFVLMPIGHSVFFRRKSTLSNRVWTHVAIIISSDELIHCSCHCGKGVVVTVRSEFLEVYALTSKLANNS
jgi:cell wall-associated NlpC family hydrolase